MHGSCCSSNVSDSSGNIRLIMSWWAARQRSRRKSTSVHSKPCRQPSPNACRLHMIIVMCGSGYEAENRRGAFLLKLTRTLLC